MRQLKEAVMKVIDTLTQEDFQRPSRSCWNSTSALQPKEITLKGTPFMCVLSIKVPIQKKVWKLI